MQHFQPKTFRVAPKAPRHARLFELIRQSNVADSRRAVTDVTVPSSVAETYLRDAGGSMRPQSTMSRALRDAI